MNLFQINDEIEKCIDQETGEILDIEALNNLSMEKDTKIEKPCLLVQKSCSRCGSTKSREKTLFAEREKIRKKQSRAD